MENLFKFTEEHTNIEWNWFYISGNPNITKNIVEKNQSLWDIAGLSRNPNINPEFIISHNLNFDSFWYSQNPNISLKFIHQHPTKQWEWSEISSNPAITMDIVEQNLNEMWDFNYLSNNPNIYIEYVDKNFNKDWNWFGISKNPSINTQIIESRSSYPWDRHGIARNPNIKTCTLDFILKFGPWSENEWLYILQSISLETIELLMKLNTPNITERTDWLAMSANPNIKDILRHNQHHMNWYYVSKNSSITIADVEDNPDFTWSIKGLSLNPNLQLKYVENHMNLPWDWDGIAENTFGLDYKNFEKQQMIDEQNVVLYENYGYLTNEITKYYSEKL